MLLSDSRGQLLEEQFCRRFDFVPREQPLAARLRNLLAYRNDRFLHRRTCSFSGVPIISAYNDETPFPVITSALWWGDTWDASEFGCSFDADEDFFRQFAELQRVVPREGTSAVNAENCEFNSHTRESKNCYLSHLAFRCEGALYSFWSVDCCDILGGFYSTGCELCAHCSYVVNCYNCVHVEESSQCRDCFFSFQLRNCSNCLFCTDLVGKEYHIRNKPYPRAEYERIVSDFGNALSAEGYAEALEEYRQLLVGTPRRATYSLLSEDFSGEHLVQCKNAFHCFDLRLSEDCYHATNGGGKNLFHTYSVGFPECDSVYSSVTIRSSSQIFFSSNCWESFDLWYCDNCVQCKPCFGCVGLKRREFCILNRQYSETEYRRLVAELRGSMEARGEFGRFFPEGLSPFAYNKSAAYDFFPLDRVEIERQGLRFHESSRSASHADAKGDGETPACSSCHAQFRITARERELSQSFSIPLDIRCPQCRLTSRLHSRDPYALFEHSCASCRQKVTSSSSPLDGKAVICEPCYLNRS